MAEDAPDDATQKAEAHLSWLARPAIAAAAARADWWTARASPQDDEGALTRLARARTRDRDATIRLRKTVQATISSLQRAGYPSADVTEAIRGFMLNALALASVPAPVMDALVADAAKWVQGRLERTSPRSRVQRRR